MIDGQLQRVSARKPLCLALETALNFLRQIELFGDRYLRIHQEDLVLRYGPGGGKRSAHAPSRYS